MPIKLLYIGIGGAAILLMAIAILSTEKMEIGRGMLMAVVGTLWIWIAGVILSEAIGRTNWSPLSGMTLIAVTLLIIISSGLDDTRAAVVSAIMVGAAACVAMSQATDLMLDLKTGYLVGATPRQQQYGQFMGAWLGPILIMVLIFVLHEAYGLGGDKLPAPQGQALASMVNGIIMASFLVGAFISVLNPTQVNWSWFAPVLAVGIVALFIYRKAHHAEARASHRLSGNLQILQNSLANILSNLETLNKDSVNLPVYEAGFEIDRLLREDLNHFANARESMKHVFGLQHYADVMSAFAAGERYINRVWSASTDGYVDEVRSYLERATQQFRDAGSLFAKFQQQYETTLSQV